MNELKPWNVFEAVPQWVAIPGVATPISCGTVERARMVAETPALINAVNLLRSIIKDGAEVGFNPNYGTWADRLFATQGVTKPILDRIEGKS